MPSSLQTCCYCAENPHLQIAPSLEGSLILHFLKLRIGRECFHLQVQEISLNFHCKCEQYIQFATGSFFNFNGTAGMTSTLRPSSVLEDSVSK